MKPNRSTRIKAIIFSVFIHSALVFVVAMASFEYFKQQKQKPLEVTMGDNGQTQELAAEPALPAELPAKVEAAKTEAPVRPEIPTTLPEKKSEAVVAKPKAEKSAKVVPVPVQTPKKAAAKPEVAKTPVAAKNSDETFEVDEKELPQAVVQEEKLAETLPVKEESNEVQEEAPEAIVTQEVPQKEEEVQETETAAESNEEEESVDPQAAIIKKSDEEKQNTEASSPQTALTAEEEDWTKELQAAALPMAQASQGSGAGKAGNLNGKETGLVRSEAELTPQKGNAQAVYPPLARVKRVQGTAIVRFSVNEKGQVSQAWLQTSSGSKAIDEEALKTQKTWKYQPGKVGIFQKSWVFRLKGEPEEMPYKIR